MPDGLPPQHLIDMIGPESGEGGKFTQGFTEFCQHHPSGDTPDFIIFFLFGASLIAVSKRGGGI